ncbi:DUF305 domain-containing protein [Actinokineospora inagensis]|uniref:DUF305 domain-containing protein n=1 Tax=Actinokineospora inagensis TaxID=103730 RepID=UPI001FE0DD12|nr:DUF305 domain-containing protein [Actinokineospora inagensis]
MLVLFLAAGVAACTTEPTAHNPVVQPGKPGEDNRTLSPQEAQVGTAADRPNDADLDYARMMIVHHQQAIDMAALAPDRAANPTLKAFAARVADSQGPEIAVMNGWLRAVGQPEVDPHQSDHPADHAGHDMGHTMPGMATPEQVARLRAATGPAFDTLFVQLMTRHHQGAIEMANAVRRTGSAGKIQEWADNVVAEQSAEIQRMTAIGKP